MSLKGERMARSIGLFLVADSNKNLRLSAFETEGELTNLGILLWEFLLFIEKKL